MVGVLFFVVVGYIIFREEDVGNIKVLAFIVGVWGILAIFGAYEIFDINVYAFGIGTVIGAVAVYISSNAIANLIHRVMRK